MTQELVVLAQQLIGLAQELDRFDTLGEKRVALRDDVLTLSQRRGMTSAFGENHSSQRGRIVGKFQEGGVVHDVE